MRVDVSEIKAYKGCKRQWKLTSRNCFHLRPMVTPSHFALGTIFHESLHSMYMGASLDKVMQFVRREISQDSEAALLAMVPGYYKKVLPGDLDRYEVLDIEHHFSFVPTDPDTGEVIDPDVEVCGSIDMIVLDPEENAIYGFEHKTCKNFRDSTFMWMDEQPRVYTYALMLYVRDYNEKKHTEWVKQCEEMKHDWLVEWMKVYQHNRSGVGGSNLPEEPEYPAEPEPVTLGGIYINEVKKLLRDFKYQRTLCKYPKDDLSNFMKAFFGTCCACHKSVVNNDPAYPSPSYFNCSMCDYKTICETYMYSTLDKDEVLEEFKEEFKVREADHLEEKTERTTQN